MHRAAANQVKWKGASGSADASELGLKPSEWPDYIELRNTRAQTTRLFNRAQPLAHKAGFEYRSVRGLNDIIVLAVFND